MSIALKYTTLKDAGIPLAHFRAERRRHRNRRPAAIVSMVVLAVLLPLFFLYVLVSPQGYRPWTSPQANESAFLEEYSSSPVPTPVVSNYLAAQ